MGTGPMTGRRAGYCAGYDEPGFANPASRLGLARGFRGGGHGWRHWFYATGLPRWARWGYSPPTPQQEAEALKDQTGWLKDQLDAINKRIAEIESK
jgi:hypothetical protein